MDIWDRVHTNWSVGVFNKQPLWYLVTGRLVCFNHDFSVLITLQNFYKVYFSNLFACLFVNSITTARMVMKFIESIKSVTRKNKGQYP